MPSKITIELLTESGVVVRQYPSDESSLELIEAIEESLPAGDHIQIHHKDAVQFITLPESLMSIVVEDVDFDA